MIDYMIVNNLEEASAGHPWTHPGVHSGVESTPGRGLRAACTEAMQACAGESEMCGITISL
ncbi:hypothetical protein [Thauera sp. SDU_THAU2]|uniref:hypothetical protein n=1 Tax=Thauera sp. SDU_THAU2 TaxID=3136633 RepID=UPI00311F6EA6